MKKVWNGYADTIFVHGKIYTADVSIEEIRQGKYAFPIYEDGYIAVKDGNIIALGDSNMELYKGETTRIVDLKGQTVLPGLIDSHMHALFAGIALNAVQLDTCTSLDMMVMALKERAASMNSFAWIIGSAWNELGWNDGKKPDCHVLDEVTTEYPIAAKRLCGHVLVVNSKAMELAGITDDIEDPVGGTIGRDEDGKPNGWFYEPAAIDLIEKHIPIPTIEELVDDIEKIGQYMNASGLTSVIDCNLNFDQMKAYQKAYKTHRLTYRSHLTFYLDKAVGDIPYHLQRIEEMTAATGFGDDMVKMNSIKILLDGIPASGTAYMREPYAHMPETRGYSTITPEELNEVCRRAAKYEWQMGVHAIGDAAMDMVLEAYKEGSLVKDNRENRNYIIHAVFPREDMLPLFHDLNVSVTVQPSIMGCMGEEAILTPELAALNQPAGLYFDQGIICGGGTDFPVIDCNPFLGMSKAVSRVGLDGQVHGPEYCVSPEQALLMWTMCSAYLCFSEEKIGSLAVGKKADFIVVDTPILEVTPEEMAQTKVLATYLEGTPVYQS